MGQACAGWAGVVPVMVAASPAAARGVPDAATVHLRWDLKALEALEALEGSPRKFGATQPSYVQIAGWKLENGHNYRNIVDFPNKKHDNFPASQFDKTRGYLRIISETWTLTLRFHPT